MVHTGEALLNGALVLPGTRSRFAALSFISYYEGVRVHRA